jgi:hypothetical protein
MTYNLSESKSRLGIIIAVTSPDGTCEIHRNATNGTPSMVVFMQELGAGDRAIMTKSIHHSRI